MRSLVVPVALSAAAVLVAVAAAGCTRSDAGTPSPGSTSAASSASTTAGTPRPGVIDLTAADPCKLLNPVRLAAWAVDRPPSSSRVGGTSKLADAPACAFGSNAEQTGFLIVTSASVGMDEYLLDIPDSPSRRTIMVRNFPAVQQEGQTSAPERGSGVCFVDVNVADGQLLEIQYSQIAASQEKRLPVETLCAKAVEVAEATVTSLQGG